MPLAVIKNRIQAAPDVWPPKYRGMADAAAEIYSNGGVRGFYAGFTPAVLRAIPANAAAFAAFELAAGSFTRLQNEVPGALLVDVEHRGDEWDTYYPA